MYYVVFCFLVLVVSTRAVDCLERLVSEMTCYVLWDVKPCTLTWWHRWCQKTNRSRHCNLLLLTYWQ